MASVERESIKLESFGPQRGPGASPGIWDINFANLGEHFPLFCYLFHLPEAGMGPNIINGKDISY
jgi:hypothetical protein